MFLVNWFWRWLFQLGFFEKNANIILVGLDNAGKTTFLQTLKLGKIVATIPTHRPQEEAVQINGLSLRVFDLGGHEAARHIWREFYTRADAIIFMVDAADSERLPEASEELHALFQDEMLAGAPFLVLANKMDLAEALPRSRVTEELGIPEEAMGSIVQDALDGERSLEVFGVSVCTGAGMKEALSWLSEELIQS